MSQPHPSSPGYPTVGEVIDGKYQIERMLGEGGMGAVARAIHLVLRAPVALKFMNPQFVTYPGAVDRFLNEGVASRSIQSEHVVQVDDVGKLPTGAPYLVMDCLDGQDLAELLRNEGSPGLPFARAVHFVLQILRGLQAAHAAGIVHRDMKPSNCFVVAHEGEADFVKILDFGISKVQVAGGAALTQTNSALGTPLYMSPEQARSPRDVDARSDLYSVGVILYELLSGATPFFSETGEFTEILFKLFTADPPPIQEKRADISADLARVVHLALAREPAERFQSARELAEALMPFADDRSTQLAGRIRGYAPRKSNLPAADAMPPSAVAFSALETRQSKRPPGMSESPPAPVAAISPGPPSAVAAVPQEMIASTQLDVERARKPALVPGVRTDLGASREIAPLSERTARRSAIPYAIGAAVFAVLVMGGLFLSGILPPRQTVVVTPTSGLIDPVRAPANPPVSLAPPSAAPPSSNGNVTVPSAAPSPSGRPQPYHPAPPGSVSTQPEPPPRLNPLDPNFVH